jgi:hypothetical protein
MSSSSDEYTRLAFILALPEALSFDHVKRVPGRVLRKGAILLHVEDIGAFEKGDGG